MNNVRGQNHSEVSGGVPREDSHTERARRLGRSFSPSHRAYQSLPRTWVYASPENNTHRVIAHSPCCCCCCWVTSVVSDSVLPLDSSPPGSSIPRILQARILEWVAISFSNAGMHAKSLQSCLTLCNPITAAHQAPPSTGFSRQE